MMSIFLIMSVMACFSIIISLVTLAVGMRKMQKNGDVEVVGVAASPLVSIIVPACNEEENIEKSLLSLLAQDYDNLQIIVINDRSTDNTAQILNHLKDRFSRLIVYEIVDLPEGWIGKSHAISKGAALAEGKYLVFTDADVLLKKTTISRAVPYITKNRLDHLTLIFKTITKGWLLNSLILDVGMGLLFIFRPWMVKKSGNHSFIGIGAFNMVKKTVYQEIGGHEGIKMHPIDGMMLGKTIKEHGFFQDCLLAYDFCQSPMV